MELDCHVHDGMLESLYFLDKISRIVYFQSMSHCLKVSDSVKWHLLSIYYST